MNGGGSETPLVCEAAPGGGGGGGKKKDSGTAGSPAHLIIKDLGEIHSRLLDHRPVIQGETRYFVKEFEEKRGLREMRVLENLKNMIHETNEHTLPTCRETMQDNLNQVLQRLQAATDLVCRLQQREQERKKMHNDHLIASEKQHMLQREGFMKEQQSKRAEVDKEHRQAMERLEARYAGLARALARRPAFGELEPTVTKR
ncbi:biogenesis of lysosome-related organelles complex 1 subunit 5 isoform X1 [Kogia breviceps]|uniref:biogenesis of lysosome-related organelles complex 1 subunit 5 isoform X1 n=1 Tax=Kogia breviceps TaxID=27615 RepID=UPI002795CE34|nr:biogenesis of lysosome-related organelles complex 1 subunit 5 [Kogia breviceps]